ncbi:MAG: RpiB/LacA/LacB family sugar-phosphate isomerase [Firmicutes bacterium]|nr:RpiB/LacA/LacB family sugar-phosphate isomerase [Bacillota bacterium]
MIYLTYDHGGFDKREIVCDFLKKQKLKFIDLGAKEFEALDDFPDFANPACVEILKDIKKNVGIFMCGSGVGMCIAANRFKGINAAVCHTADLAKLAREHNNINVLCVPSRFLSKEQIIEIINTFLTTKFLAGKYARRMEKVNC